jgi:cation transport regulator ChaC
MSNLQWDAELGVWVGDKAPGFDLSEFPRPLYVFGYGSLIWKPGPFLERFSSFPATALGYKRLFAQRSYDHRGNQFFPGLVLNLVDNESLLSRGYSVDSNDLTPNIDDCRGLVWIVPEEEIPPLIDYLDFREKGGYFQTLIDVRLHDSTPFHPINDTVKALVYIGHSYNPNYFLTDFSSEKVTKSARLFDNFQRRSIVTDIISAAVGPSGPNIEYLLNLYADLQSRNIQDPYLKKLVTAVKLRIGVWRRRHYNNKVFSGEVAEQKFEESPFPMHGFGSNEFHQLTMHKEAHPVESKINGIYQDRCYYESVEISNHLPTASIETISSFQTFRESIPWEELEYYHLLAGSNSSALLNSRTHTLQIWGRLSEIILRNHFNASFAESNPFSIILYGVKGAAIGYEHLLLLCEGENRTICLGENQFGQCNGPSQYVVPYQLVKLIQLSSSEHLYKVDLSSLNDESLSRNEQRSPILKLAAGLHHSAFITEDGGLGTFGQSKYGQCLESQELWYPPNDRFTNNPTKLIDICCGSKHTVVLDNYGAVYSLGDNRYGSLGREVLNVTQNESARNPKQIDSFPGLVNLPQDVKFQRVRYLHYYRLYV